MDSSRDRSHVINRMIWVMLGISVGICVQILRITNRPKEFRSLAKIAAEASHHQAQLPPFYASVIGTLESIELRRRALERVRALHPEYRDNDVDIRAVQAKDSSIFNVLATSREPSYTRVYLDALLVEFIARRQEMRERMHASDINHIVVHERPTVASEHIEDWTVPVLAGVVVGGLLGAVLGLLFHLMAGHFKAPLQVPFAT